jgi:Zn-dependent membrane protease YugP
MFFWNDPTFILLIPAVILAVYAQWKVRSTYKRFSQVSSSRGMSGAATARAILDESGLRDVPVEVTPGNLTDHYDPKARVLRLSTDVYNGTSIAALGIAGHESGHAIQHQESYAPLAIRNAIFPVVSLGSWLAMPLFFVGLLLSSMRLLDLGIILFSVVVLFQVVTLPVEFNASDRAMAILGGRRYLVGDEVDGAKRVLSAAALTYVAAAAMAVLNLLRFILLRNASDD